VSEALLTARQVAEMLGISPDTALDWFEQGRIPGFRLTRRIGSPVRFRGSEIDAWVEHCRCGPEPGASTAST
jgi:excisionase family DNA binding protein